jgi:mono/diheme cytochrome c family protein
MASMRWRCCNELLGLGLLASLGLAACAPPGTLPPGPTPIPTLAPVSRTIRLPETPEGSGFTILSYPARMPSAAEGERIYQLLCTECHGQDGTGTMPAARNFRDLDYIRGETPADFYAASTEGRAEMPAYRDTLSSDERWDVVFYIWRLSTTTEVLQAGQAIYQESCAACHGLDGSGEVLGSADFTDLRQMDELAPRDLYLTITQGRGSMPAWQARLSQDERWAVIDYLWAFSYNPNLGSGIAETETLAAGAASPAAACSGQEVNPFAWEDARAIVAGQGVYASYCALCHGPEGQGGLPGTPDFSSSQFNAELLNDPGRYFCGLTSGIGTMPGFDRTLTAEERWQALTYLASLGP